MNTRKYFIILLAVTCIAVFAAGCTGSKPAASAPSATAAAPAASAPAPTTTPCPYKEVLTGSWDTREVGYASNHDVREPGVWSDAGSTPVTLTQGCWDAAGTFKWGDCDGTLKGKLEKTVLGAFVYSGTFSRVCTNTIDTASGTFSVTMAADNLSFLGSMYKNCPGCYGP